MWKLTFSLLSCPQEQLPLLCLTPLSAVAVGGDSVSPCVCYFNRSDRYFGLSPPEREFQNSVKVLVIFKKGWRGSSLKYQEVYIYIYPYTQTFQSYCISKIFARITFILQFHNETHI